MTQAIAAEQIERSDSTSSMSLAAKLNLQAAASAASEPATADAARPEIRLTDEQLQLVSRILMDNQVIRAAQEETLPPAPGDVNSGTNGTNGTKHDVPHLDGDPMYYGECCPPQPRLFWTAGVEATFLNPDLNTDGVSVDVEEIDENRHDICTTLSNDIDSIYVSPRIWLGVQGCAWGANLRYWHLQASEGAYDPSIGGLGTWTDYDCGVPDFGFTTCSRLEAYTIDLELTRRFCLNDCAMQAAMGIRHAEIDHDESLWALANADRRLAHRYGPGQSPVARHRPAVRPVWPQADIPLLLRALVLQRALVGLVGPHANVGRNVRLGAYRLPTRTFPGTAASVNGAYTNVDDTLFIGEIQLGLEWDYCLQCVPGQRLFPGGARISAMGRRQRLFAVSVVRRGRDRRPGRPRVDYHGERRRFRTANGPDRHHPVDRPDVVGVKPSMESLVGHEYSSLKTNCAITRRPAAPLQQGALFQFHGPERN